METRTRQPDKPKSPKSPIKEKVGKAYKVIVQECGELLKRLRREESWSIVCFITGEAFELRNGRLRRCQ